MMTRDEILTELVRLLRDIYSQTEGFLDLQDDAQRWYDRGYANGMVVAIRELGHESALPADLVLDLDGDTPNLIAQQSLMPWGRAYAHGADMGHKETLEVLETA